MKKVLKLFFVTVLAFICAALLVGCGEQNDGGRIMNLSCNPRVEFILDADDKVVSVNALNEEGNLVVSAEVFVGKSAEDAAKLFVQISKDAGFLVTGNVNAGENELEISFSGDAAEAEALYNSVKTKINEYISAEGITVAIEKAAAITEEQLEALLAECAPYLETAKVEAMEYSELMTELAKSRKETAEFYSQELKNAYYEAKAFAMEQAELQAVKVQEGISGISAIAFDTAYGLYTTAVELVESTRMEVLVNEDSPYQLALKAFREAKTDYLNYRNYVASLEQNEITTQISQQLASYQSVVDAAEAALISAGETANNALDTVKAQLRTAYDSVVLCIEEYSAKVSQYAGEIAAKREEAETAFFADFEDTFAAAITAAEANWNDMKTELEGGYIAE